MILYHLYNILYYTDALLVVIGLNSTTNTNYKRDIERESGRKRSFLCSEEECLDKTFGGLLLGTMFNHLGVQFNRVTAAFGLDALETLRPTIRFRKPP